jgi:hypothetical protein
MSITVTIQINETIDIEIDDLEECSIREWINDNYSLDDFDWTVYES